MPFKTPNALLHGTLDALILKTLVSGPRHGYAIAKFIEDASDESVIVEEGSLYPALYRMERRGWLEAEWGESELGRRAKLYRLTREGRAQLNAETAAWRQFAAGGSKILLAPGTVRFAHGCGVYRSIRRSMTRSPSTSRCAPATWWRRGSIRALLARWSSRGSETPRGSNARA